MIRTVPTDDKGMLQRPGLNAGMVEKEKQEKKPVNCVSVEDIDGSIKRVKKLRKNSYAETASAYVGWVATTTDPEGNLIP